MENVTNETAAQSLLEIRELIGTRLNRLQEHRQSVTDVFDQRILVERENELQRLQTMFDTVVQHQCKANN